ncbi:MAG: S26 family signal peptidase [Kofleriaceae bacterium]
MWLTLAAALTAASAAVIAVARRRYLLVTVVGHSMAPTLHNGQRLLARRTQRVRRADIIAFLPPPSHRHDASLVYRVKRVIAIAGDPTPVWLGADPRVPAGKLVVLGDNPDSEDSRHYGYVDQAAIVAVITDRSTDHCAHRSSDRDGSTR